jgi:hypothetical protein
MFVSNTHILYMFYKFLVVLFKENHLLCLLTYLLYQRSRVFLEKLTCSQIVKKFPTYPKS